MKISQKIADSIVVELSKVIGQHINLMDDNGIIIASTDKKRIGSFHNGAKKILDEHLKELVIYSDDEELGSKKGLNLPIEMDGKYVGVIGITGEYEDVKKYGYIIKKITEILVLDDELKEQKNLERSARSRFIREWLVNGADTNEPYFKNQARSLGINLDDNWRIVVISAVSDEQSDSLDIIRRIKNIETYVYKIFSKDGLLFVNNGEKYILMVPNIKYDDLLIDLEKLSKEVYKNTKLNLRIGLSKDTSKAASARSVYLKCDRALKTAIKDNEIKPVVYDELDLELIINDLKNENKNEFIKRVFRNCSNDEIKQYRLILNTYYANDCSINKTSEVLFIHKNTLQYKLNKLAEKTEIDPRSVKGIVLYNLALNFIDS